MTLKWFNILDAEENNSRCQDIPVLCMNLIGFQVRIATMIDKP